MHRKAAAGLYGTAASTPCTTPSPPPSRSMRSGSIPIRRKTWSASSASTATAAAPPAPTSSPASCATFWPPRPSATGLEGVQRPQGCFQTTLTSSEVHSPVPPTSFLPLFAVGGPPLGTSGDGEALRFLADEVEEGLDLFA